MSGREFALQPFPADQGVPAVTIQGSLDRRGADFAIDYCIGGRLAELIIPAPTAAPARRWLLWEATCCEFFLAVPGAEGYWEFNLSPGGDWNVFHLSGYRQGIREEEAISQLVAVVQRQPDEVRVSLAVDLAAILPADQPWQVAVSTVLKHQDGRYSYWALCHPGPRPDFHDRASFIITV
mgnify:CR=1 FL=1